MPDNVDPVLKTPEAAEALGMHRDSLVQLVKDGKIPCFTTPGGHRRFRRSDIDAYKARTLPEPQSEPVEQTA